MRTMTRFVALSAVLAVAASGCKGGGTVVEEDPPPPVTYTISGFVNLDSGPVLAGVTITLSGASSGSTTTNTGGYYSFSSLADGNYTVTPSRAGYTFAPTSRPATVSGASVSGLSFTATPPATYTISGAVTLASDGALAGVTVALSGTISHSTITDAGGQYSFSGLIDGNYTVTPSLGGYTFAPTSKAVTVSGSSVGNQDFSATPPPTYTISGSVNLSAGGRLGGVVVALSGPSPGTATTDASGQYSFSGLGNGGYTVTPTLGGYTFAPTSRSVTVNGSSAPSQDFTATAVVSTFKISGTMLGGARAGVTITLSGTPDRTAVTDASGNYAFTGVANGTYTLTPSLAGFTFSPVDRTVLVSGADLTGRDFTAFAVAGTHRISGTVSGAVTAGVTITLSGTPARTTTTDAAGAWSFAGIADGSYTVTPGKGGYSFSPASRSVTVGGADVTAQDFTATATNYEVIQVCGRVDYSGQKTGRVFVVVYGYFYGRNELLGGTSLPAAGPFCVHIQNFGSGSVGAMAWMDTLGIDRYNEAADPGIGYLANQPLPASGTTVDLGTVALSDPTPNLLPPTPSVEQVIPTDQGAAVVYQIAINNSQVEAADHYRIFWSALPNPGPSNKLGSLDVPAGPPFGIVRGLVNGSDYYFSVLAIRGARLSNQSAGVGPVRIGPPQGSVAIGGTLNFPSPPPGSNDLYVVAQQVAAGPAVPAVRAVRFPNPTSPLTYSIPVPDGAYQLAAFFDFGSDGIVKADEAVGLFFQDRSPLVTVSGANVTVPPLAIPTGSAVTGVATIREVTTSQGNTSTRTMLEFAVGSNRKVPVKATITAGPYISDPVDIGLVWNDYNPSVQFQQRWWPLSGSWTPVVGDAYTVEVTFADGTVETLPVAVTGLIENPPEQLSPLADATGVNRTPTFTWAVPAPLPTAEYVYSIDVRGFGSLPGWSYSPMPSSQTSVTYNADNSAYSGSVLQANWTWYWTISVTDRNGNVSRRTSSFTTVP